MAERQKKPITVLVVEDSDPVADALEVLLEVKDFKYIGQLRSAGRLLAEVRLKRPDIVMLDIAMPGPDPFEAMQRAAALRPASRTVVFSGMERRELIERALDCGAWGFISKHECGESIRDGLRRVAAGEVVISDVARAAL